MSQGGLERTYFQDGLHGNHCYGCGAWNEKGLRIKSFWDGAEADAYDPARNTGLKSAIRDAKRTLIPETYIKRVLDYARQGHTGIEFPTYDTDWDSEAYSTVSGQNSNNTIRVTNAFLQAVEKDADWQLINRVDGKVSKTLRARDLWEQVGHAEQLGRGRRLRLRRHPRVTLVVHDRDGVGTTGVDTDEHGARLDHRASLPPRSPGRKR